MVNGYGPQEYDTEDKKYSFWKYFDDEVLNCKKEGSALIFLFDGNAWLGPSIIENDPHIQNKNGEMLHNFLMRNPNLILLNSSKLCEGVVTRSRRANEKNENSVIDFAIVCDKIFPFVTKLLIDEQKIYSLTNYVSKTKIVYSDHNSLVINMNI